MKAFLLLAVVALFVGACSDGGKGGPKNSDGPFKPTGEESVHTAVVMANLELTRFNDERTEARNNFVKIENKKTGTKIFEVRYLFNSGNSTRFKIMQISRRGFCSGDTKMFISHDGKSEETNLLRIETLKLNSDYVLTLRSEPQTCNIQDATVGAVVWLGLENEQPELAVACAAKDLTSPLRYFPNINFGVGYLESSNGDIELMVGDRQFCGVEADLSQGLSCQNGSSISGDYSAVCEGKKAGNKLMSGIYYTAQNRTADVTCTVNDQEIYQKEFVSCISTVLDLKKYQKQ